MNRFFLLFPILFPFIGALIVRNLKTEDTRKRNTLYEAVVVLSAACVWALILNRPSEPLTFYSFTDYFSITLRLDGFGSFFSGMSSTLWVFAMIYAFSYMADEERAKEFLCYYVMTFGVTMGICFAGNMITMFVFYEMLTLITIPLVVHEYNHESMYAGRKYALFSFGGSAFAFIGVVVLGVFAGGTTFKLGGYAATISQISRDLLYLIYVLTFMGFGVKSCVFPLHSWLPTASVAPTPVTALLHAVAVVKAGIFAIIRLTYYCFGASFLLGSWAQKVVQVIVMFTVVYAAVKAVKERHFKRRLAYSTVSNLSYILIGVTLMTEAGMAAGLCHICLLLRRRGAEEDGTRVYLGARRDREGHACHIRVLYGVGSVPHRHTAVRRFRVQMAAVYGGAEHRYAPRLCGRGGPYSQFLPLRALYDQHSYTRVLPET